MRVILANPRGFCAGVRMAIDVVDQVLRAQGPPIYVYHEIVHNKHVVDDFRSRGVTFVEDVTDVPAGQTVVFSAHGIPPGVREKAAGRGLVVHDATCPLVTKVHNEVIRYAKDGYQIIFIGHRNHQEAIGTAGEAPDRITIVEEPEEVAHLSFSPGTKLVYATQTTLSVTDAQRVIAALRARFPDIREPANEDICYATTNRQDAVSAWAGEVDVVLVVGSRNSSNSNRLVDRARELGTAAYLIDEASELDPAWLAGAKSVLLTAGASAPEAYVEGVLDRLRREHGATVEERTLAEEGVAFALPRSVRKLAVIG
jgi:4-hydroxy-3-methylbut-2-enyl diphosphate reductase